MFSWKTALVVLALSLNGAGCSKPAGESPAVVEAAVATPSVSSTSKPCVAEGPCMSCIFPASGVECQNEAARKGLVRTCSFFEDTGLGRKVTVFCPPGYRAPQ